MKNNSGIIMAAVAAMSVGVNSNVFSSKWHDNNTSDNPIFIPKRSKKIKSKKKGRK